MNIYRTHNCNEVRASNSDEKVTLSGWIHKKRDHGNLVFIDLERQLWHDSMCSSKGQLSF